jgi:hypothetical protein
MAKGKGFVPFGKAGKGKPASDEGSKGAKVKPKGNPFANMKKGK